MLDQAIDIAGHSIATAFTWLEELFSKAPGTVEFFLSCFCIYAVYRFLLAPLSGPGLINSKSGSDTVKKPYSKTVKKPHSKKEK